MKEFSTNELGRSTLKSGQLLVEVLIAIFVVVVAVLGLVSVTTKSVSNSSASKRQTEATAYGMEVMEWLTARRDIMGWNEIANHSLPGGRTYCFPNSLVGVGQTLTTWNSAATSGACSGYQLGSPPGFNRDVKLTTATAGVEILVDVTVSWNEGGRFVSSKQSESLTNY